MYKFPVACKKVGGQGDQQVKLGMWLCLFKCNSELYKPQKGNVLWIS